MKGISLPTHAEGRGAGAPRLPLRSGKRALPRREGAHWSSPRSPKETSERRPRRAPQATALRERTLPGETSTTGGESSRVPPGGTFLPLRGRSNVAREAHANRRDGSKLLGRERRLRSSPSATLATGRETGNRPQRVGGHTEGSRSFAGCGPRLFGSEAELGQERGGIPRLCSADFGDCADGFISGGARRRQGARSGLGRCAGSRVQT